MSKEAKEGAADIPWNALAGFRNVVVHNYLSLDLDIVEEVVTKELPLLRVQLERLRAKASTTQPQA